MQRMGRNLDELTQEKEGLGAGKRSMKRCAALFGLSLLLVLFLQAEVLFVLMLVGDAEWSRYSGWFQWVGAFAGTTLIPYIVSHFRRKQGG